MRALSCLLIAMVSLAAAESLPEPLRYGIERDDCRVIVDLVLPVMDDDQRRRLVAVCAEAMPDHRTGTDLGAWVAARHAAMVTEMADGQAKFPGAATFSGWYHCSAFRTTWSGGGLLSVHAEHSGFSGGNHGSLEHRVIVLDTTSWKRLAVADLIAPADQPAFAQLVTASWKREQGLSPEALPSGHGLTVDELPAVLPLITATGIEVIYSPFEVGPWSTGTVRVVLTRDQARPFLRRDPWAE
jgi:hypothetical protein